MAVADTRKEYVVEIGGVKHTMLLDPDDAERRYGGRAVEVKSRTTQNKVRIPQDK